MQISVEIAIVGIALAGVLAQILAWRLKVPAILFLLLAGILGWSVTPTPQTRALQLQDSGPSAALRMRVGGGAAQAEVMVDGDEVHLIRERESYEDLVRGERIPEG